jgi:hypothetical protein
LIIKTISSSPVKWYKPVIPAQEVEEGESRVGGEPGDKARLCLKKIT